MFWSFYSSHRSWPTWPWPPYGVGLVNGAQCSNYHRARGVPGPLRYSAGPLSYVKSKNELKGFLFPTSWDPFYLWERNWKRLKRTLSPLKIMLKIRMWASMPRFKLGFWEECNVPALRKMKICTHPSLPPVVRFLNLTKRPLSFYL